MDNNKLIQMIAYYGERSLLNPKINSSGKVFKIELGGEYYKLRCCESAEEAKAIEENCRKVRSKIKRKIIPKFYGRYSNNVVFEFVKGNDLKEDISSEDACKLGELIGKLNTIPDKAVDFREMYMDAVHELYEDDIFNSNRRGRMIKIYNEICSASIETCLNYNEVLWHNFRKMKNGKILAVDDSELKKGYPLGSSLVKAIDMWFAEKKNKAKEFLKGYKSTNKKGFEFYNANKQFIHLYFWLMFTIAQVHSKGEKLRDKKDKIDNALNLMKLYV